jgi:hypothetical protein
MTKTPNYELTPGEVRNPFKPNDSGSLKKFKNDDDVQLKIIPVQMKVDDKSTPSLRAKSHSRS